MERKSCYIWRLSVYELYTLTLVYCTVEYMYYICLYDIEDRINSLVHALTVIPRSDLAGGVRKETRG